MVKRFVVRELEHTWREKFPLTKSDQFVVLLDMKGSTLKQMASAAAFVT